MDSEQFGSGAGTYTTRVGTTRVGDEVRQGAWGDAVQAASQGSSTHRVNVQFSQQAYEALVELAREEGKSLSEVLRDALKLERFFHDLRKEKARILVERDGKVRELIRV